MAKSKREVCKLKTQLADVIKTHTTFETKNDHNSARLKMTSNDEIEDGRPRKRRNLKVYSNDRLQI